jgi:hypothetical protein
MITPHQELHNQRANAGAGGGCRIPQASLREPAPGLIFWSPDRARTSKDPVPKTIHLA